MIGAKIIIPVTLIIGILIGIGAQQFRIDSLNERIASNKAAAYAQLVELQTTSQEFQTKLRNDYQASIERLEDALVGANDVQADLIDRMHNLATPADDTDGTSGQHGPSKQDQATLDLFIRLLDRHTKELITVGRYAEELKARGLHCENRYDSESLLRAPK